MGFSGGAASCTMEVQFKWNGLGWLSPFRPLAAWPAPEAGFPSPSQAPISSHSVRLVTYYLLALIPLSYLGFPSLSSLPPMSASIHLSIHPISFLCCGKLLRGWDQVLLVSQICQQLRAVIAPPLADLVVPPFMSTHLQQNSRHFPWALQVSFPSLA